MSILKIALTTSLLACIAGMGMSGAAEISLAENGINRQPMHGILIEGPIVKGDFKRFEYLALVTYESPIWLASPGGDLVEAMKIGQFVRKMKLSVWAPDSSKKFWSNMIHVNEPQNNICASACFFIYAAGVGRSGNVLGIHRPRITEDDLKEMSMEQAAIGQLSESEVTSNYLRKMGIPNSIIEKMNSTKPDDIQWLGEDEVNSLSGYIPEYQDWLDAKCPLGVNVPVDPNPCKTCSTDEQIARWNVRANSQKFKCKSGLIEEAQYLAHLEILNEYVKNGHIKEVIAEQKRACAILSAKSQRECPSGSHN